MTATKIIRNEEYGCWAVQLYDENSSKCYWMDVSYDKDYRQIDVDWNQYIFYLTDEDDCERKEFQENCNNFDEADSEVYWTLLREGEIKETDDGYLEIVVENWEEKTFEIRQ